jgi:hypothetical protein
LADAKRKGMAAFERVMRAFETQSDLARSVGVTRAVVHYWTRLGYIPAAYARGVSQACSAVGVHVSIPELLREAEIGKQRVDVKGGARVVRTTPISEENRRHPEGGE